MKLQGIITKLVGGTYSVCASDGAYYECKARGVFRNRGISPVCGDRAVIDTDACVIEEVLERKSFIVRPPIANLDVLVLVASVTEPKLNLTLIDKFSAVAVYKKIEPVVVFTKTDLEAADIYENIYRSVGYKTFCIDNTSGEAAKENAAEIKAYLKGKLSAFTGNTGVGKSSLLNNIFPCLRLSTAKISEKLGRGRHTTRHVELFGIDGGGYVADTPGFSSFDTMRYGVIKPEELDGCFPEFSKVQGDCRFLDCKHISEPDCAVKQAVADGCIAESRYKSYVEMRIQADSIKEWEIK